MLGGLRFKFVGFALTLFDTWSYKAQILLLSFDLIVLEIFESLLNRI